MAEQASPEKFDFTFKIDGQDVPAKNGDTILKAALRAGTFIPHYCYHPGLSVAGNCRICLVFATKAGPPNKPVIACATAAVEGMEVESSGPRTKAVREGVMEFLLINHPLDCPVCDQAGECDLQQYSFDYGRETSRFSEEKTQRPRKDLGPLIRYVGNRCIVCTRCVRFTDEVTQTGELSVVQRGDSSSIDTFPGVELDNPLSGCVADICPVGALLDRESVHTSRVWLLRGTRSVCGTCATGCNINVETWNDEVKRLTPRENQAVNRWWMCDEGRLSWKPAEAPERVVRARVGGAEAWYLTALERAQALIKEAAPEKLAAIGTGFATNEELFLLRGLAGKGPVGVCFAPDGAAWKTPDGGFAISADKNPNREGARRVLGEHDWKPVLSALEAGQVELLVIADANPGGAAWDPALAAAFAKARRRIVLTLRDGPHTAGADVVLPALHWTEKDGTFVNGRGRAQRVHAAVPPPGDARPDLEVLQELLRALGAQPRVLSAAGVWRRLVQARPAELGAVAQGGASGAGDYGAIGAHGLPLPGAKDTVPPEKASTGYEAGPVSRAPGRADDEQVRVSVHRGSPVGYGTSRGDH